MSAWGRITAIADAAPGAEPYYANKKCSICGQYLKWKNGRWAHPFGLVCTGDDKNDVEDIEISF